VTGAAPYGLVWAILVYAWIANYLIRMALSALLPPIMAEFGLTYAQAGLLSAAVFYAYTSMQLPAGALGDRLGRRRMVIAGVLLHRLNVAVIGLRVRHWETYVPSLGEVAITLGITAAAIFAFGWLARILPIHEELPAPETRPLPAARAAGTWHGAEGVS